MTNPPDSSIDAAPHLRDVAIEAATAALQNHQWVAGQSVSAHNRHLSAGPDLCAICARDVGRIVPVALDAADEAIRDLDDTAVLLDELQDAEGELRAGLDLHRTMLRRVALGGWRIVADGEGGWFWQHVGGGHEVICLSDPELSVFEALRAKETPSDA